MNILRLLLGFILVFGSIYYFYNQFKFKKYKIEKWASGMGQVYYGTFLLGFVGLYLILSEIYSSLL